YVLSFIRLDSISSSSLFFFHCSSTHPALHSFPYTTLFRSAVLAPAALEPQLVAGKDHRHAGGRHLHTDPDDVAVAGVDDGAEPRSEEHTSELQSRGHLVCRLLLEKKKKTRITQITLVINIQ